MPSGACASLLLVCLAHAASAATAASRPFAAKEVQRCGRFAPAEACVFLEGETDPQEAGKQCKGTLDSSKWDACDKMGAIPTYHLIREVPCDGASPCGPIPGTQAMVEACKALVKPHICEYLRGFWCVEQAVASCRFNRLPEAQCKKLAALPEVGADCEPADVDNSGTDECKVEPAHSTCYPVGQNCVDRNYNVADDWMCMCPTPSQGHAVRAAATCTTPCGGSPCGADIVYTLVGGRDAFTLQLVP
eukprot:TRINITY_DN6490_c0_g3_i2.p2 TRINITY_DN6490_c0_g3~~TRINITY_DN6490_c0_g3_i2.p2  ORF type:complete len:247 (+),score=67.07 TRINITY_DN6490_c0_g3_i2:62-802(+)